MKPILVIAPSKKLADNVKLLIADHDEDIDIKVAYMQDALFVAQKAERDGVKVIISRGGSRNLIEPCVSIPVVDIELGLESYKEALEKAQKVKGKVGYFSYKEHNREIETLFKLLRIDGKNYTFDDDIHCMEVVEKAIEEGVKIGIGGAVSDKYAKLFNLKYISIENSREDIARSIDIARQILKSLDNEQRIQEELNLRLTRYDAVFDYTHDGIIAIDKEGLVSLVNRQAENILPLGSKPYEGRHIMDLLPDTNLMKVLQTGDLETDVLLKLGNVIINTNRVPIIVDGKVEGVVATFRDIESIRTEEQKLRSRLQQKGLLPQVSFNDLLGESEAFLKVIKQGKSCSKSDLPVVIVGEEATGKCQLAKAIHGASERKKWSFVTIDCARGDEYILGALFGDENTRDGKSKYEGYTSALEMAANGTIFLKNIEKASPYTQDIIADVIKGCCLQYGQRDLGDMRPRFIIEMTNEGDGQSFRTNCTKSLYYAMTTFVIYMPSLKMRHMDYLQIALNRFRYLLKDNYLSYKESAEKLMLLFRDHPWPGNISELYKVVDVLAFAMEQDYSWRRLEAMAKTLLNDAHDLEEGHSSGTMSIGGNEVIIQRWDRRSLLEVLKRNRLNITKSAAELGCSRATLYKRLAELEIQVKKL